MNDSTFSFVDPPHGLQRFDQSTRWRDLRVDYRAHPAYADLARPGAARRLAAIGEFALCALLLLAKRIVRYEMIPIDDRKPASLGQLGRFARTALRNALLRNGPRPAAETAVATNPLAQRLFVDGCVVVAAPAHVFERLDNAAARYFALLADQRQRSRTEKRAFDDSRQVINRSAAPDLYAAIEKTLEQSGIIAAASEYVGRPVRLVDVNPQINDVTDSFWREIFPDRQLTKLPDAAYFHRDASGGDLKAIIYFTDVGPENGPFGYALGSNALTVSRLDDLIAEANDHNGFSGTDPVNRAKFAALPRVLQQKGSYGNDLADDAPLSRSVMESTWSISAPKGSIVLFDTKGTHRGGMVREGERRVVTCVIG